MNHSKISRRKFVGVATLSAGITGTFVESNSTIAGQPQAGDANTAGGVQPNVNVLFQPRSANDRVIHRPFIDDILTNFDPHAITEYSFPGPRFGQPPNSAYRSLHNIYRYPGENVISASGNFGQFCEIFPKRKIVIVKLSTYDFEKLEELFALSDKDRAAFCAIADVLAGKAG